MKGIPLNRKQYKTNVHDANKRAVLIEGCNSPNSQIHLEPDSFQNTIRSRTTSLFAFEPDISHERRLHYISLAI